VHLFCRLIVRLSLYAEKRVLHQVRRFNTWKGHVQERSVRTKRVRREYRQASQLAASANRPPRPHDATQYPGQRSFTNQGGTLGPATVRISRIFISYSWVKFVIESFPSPFRNQQFS
jgi:hypothetical protein